MNDSIKKFYNNNPYPNFSRFAKISFPRLAFEKNCEKCNKKLPDEPSILIIGCGTVATRAIAEAYPDASEITAIDISEKTIELAKKYTPPQLNSKIKWLVADIENEEILEKLPIGYFDLIHCTGVIHHLENPEKGIKNLSKLIKDDGIIKFQLYSKGGRLWIEWARTAFKLKNAKNKNDIANILVALSKYHPFRYVMATYPESLNNAGLLDGFLHPQVKVHYLSDWNNLLKENNLEISYIENLYYLDNLEEFIPKNLLESYNQMNVIDKITILEKLGEWRSDFKGIITKNNNNNHYNNDEKRIHTDIICDIKDNISYPRHYIWQETKSAIKNINQNLKEDELKYILNNLNKKLWLPGIKGNLLRLKWASLSDIPRNLASYNTIFKEKEDELIDDFFNNNFNSYIPTYEQWPWKQWQEGFFAWEW